MSTSPARRSLPATTDASPDLDSARSVFDKLQQRIAQHKVLLADWQAAMDAYEQRYLRDVLPLLNEYRALHVALLERLDHAATGGMRLGRTDARILRQLIVDMASGLLLSETDPAQRARLVAWHRKYDDDAVADDATESAAPAADEDDPEALLRRLEAEQAEAAAERERQRGEHRREAKKRRQQRQPEAVEASQSLRAVYRQLVSTLHPDRESDPAERQRKTALMQRVNEAYAAERLAELLELQQEAAAFDARHAGQQPEERLAAYIRLLTQQLAKLQQDLRALEADFKQCHHLNPRGKLKPATLAEHLRVEQATLNNSIRELQREQRWLNDPDHFKQWLRAQRR